MEVKRIDSGKLRAIGYDARARMLRVGPDDGTLTNRYARFMLLPPAGKNPLDELFRKS